MSKVKVTGSQNTKTSEGDQMASVMLRLCRVPSLYSWFKHCLTLQISRLLNTTETLAHETELN